MPNVLDLKKDGKEKTGNRIDRPNMLSKQEEYDELNEYQNEYEEEIVEPANTTPSKPSSKQNEIPYTTLGLMIGTAIFFDTIQILFEFLFMGWMVSFFAFLTFWLWFKLHGRSFASPKKALTLGAGAVIEIIPILSALPGWTLTIIFLVGIEKAEKKARELLGEGTIGNKLLTKAKNLGK